MSWLTGTCVLFAGVRAGTDETKDDTTTGWSLESDDETKHRLTEALLQVGIPCQPENLEILHHDNTDGTKFCKGTVCYHPPRPEDATHLNKYGFVDLLLSISTPGSPLQKSTVPFKLWKDCPF